jgi:hypothetical protein
VALPGKPEGQTPPSDATAIDQDIERHCNPSFLASNHP